MDVTSQSLLGKEKFKTLRPAARQLTTSNPASTARYISYVEGELERRNLHDKLCDVLSRLCLNNHDVQAINDLEAIDTQPLPFSLPVSFWVHKKWACQALARVADGRCRNVGNALRRAQKAGISDTDLSLAK